MSQVAAPRADRLAWMGEHWGAYRGAIPILLLLALVNAALLTMYPLVVKWIIDGITTDVSAGVLVADTAILFALGLTQFAVYVVMQFLRAKQNLRFEFSVRMRAFEQLMRLGPASRSRFRTGDVVTRLTDDVAEKLAWFMCSGIGRVIEAIAIIIFGVAMMISIDPELTLYTAGPLPILIALFVLTGGRLHDRYAKVQDRISKLNDSLESTFSGIRVVKAFAAEDGQKAAVEHAIEQQKEAEVDAVRWQTVIDQMYGQVWQFAIIGVLLAGGAMVIRGDATLGTLVSFDMYVLMLVWPMFDVGQFLVKGRLSAVSIDRIAELESQPPEIADGAEILPTIRTPEDPDSPLSQGERPGVSAVQSDGNAEASLSGPRHGLSRIHFDSASYTWPGADQPAVEDISFVAAPGAVTAIAGEIGCGKSTALLLVPRVMDPQAGRILVNDEPLAELDLFGWREQVGYVPQEPQLLAGTIAENVRFGRSEISDEQVALALDVSQFAPDRAEFPDGVETEIGHRGTRLSGGQKQRVSLARAIAGRPNVLLLDDCTASLDARTEAAVWNRLLEFLPDCTTLIVTHRPATLQRADQIVLLRNGRVEDCGAFRELNRPQTYFASLYSRWQLEERVAEA